MPGFGKRNKLDDLQLLTAARNGDENAFKELVLKYENQVAATVIGMIGYGPQAEDIGQETFLRFYKSLSKFRGEAGIGTYLTRIAINLCLDEIKRMKKKRTLFASNPGEQTQNLPDTKNSPLKGEVHKMVHWGLQQLEPKFRTVIVLRLLDGYTARETAQILHLPIGTVLSRLIRAQQKLKEILTPVYTDQHEVQGETHE